ncbi:MAG: NADH-quinone oxidoreductase subunit C [Candidatus Zixiibacteriota bacterium]|nr:MAG: NADH-quinone oxidoreductase subunit C [candidate division Zixibacteria bacterium]
MREKVSKFLHSNFGDWIISEETFRDQQSIFIKPEALSPICRSLLEDETLGIRFLSDITSVDWLGHAREKDGRFEVVYNLYSLKYKYRFFLKVHLPADNPQIDSLTPLWEGANWMEREVWDMMGITFIGHPDLTRILNPEDMEGHPLRRDYSLTWEQPQFTWNKDRPPEIKG